MDSNNHATSPDTGVFAQPWERSPYVVFFLGELRGGGNLRLYGFVQFYTAVMVPVIVLLFPCPCSDDRPVLEALGLYALAMLCGELLDAQIFALGQIVSGHTLKHLLAGAAAYRVLRRLRARRR